MKAKLLLTMLMVSAVMVSAQDTIRSLVITEWRGEWSHNSYLELTNMGDSVLDLSEFTLGLFSGGDSYAAQPDERVHRLSGTLDPGESYVVAGVAEGSEPWIYPPMYPKIHPRILAEADLKVFLAEDANRLIAAGLTPEDDSVSVGFEDLMSTNRGERAHFLFHHTAEDDSVVVDGVGLNFNANGTLNFQNEFKDVAGELNATETHILVRKFNQKTGEPDWNSSRGLTPEESQWMVIPFETGWYNRFSGEYNLAGNHGVYTIDAASMKPAEGVAIDIDFDNNEVTVPWGVYRDTLGKTPWKYMDLGDGLAWGYTLTAVREDSAFSTCQDGDILTMYAVGNELQKVDFTLNVTPPTNDMNLVFPKRTTSSEGFYNEGTYYMVTQGDPVIDSIVDVAFATRVDTLLVRLEMPANADWRMEWVDGTERADLKNGDKLVVVAENGDEKEYFIKVDEYEPNTNASLSAITWPEIPEYLYGGAGWKGDTLPNFLPSGYAYEITVPFGVKSIPALMAHTANTNATVDIDRATSLRGSLEDRTTVITVTAEDQETVNEYKIIFKKEILQDWIQPFHADPFMSQVARHVWFKNFWTEFYNPGNQDLDMSRYMLMLGMNGATPSEAIQYDPAFADRYVKYVPGRKYVDDETTFATDKTLKEDFVVDPIVKPKEVWLFGQYADRENRLMPSIMEITDFHLSPTVENAWGITYDGMAQVSTHSYRKWPLYLFKILNDSVRNGTKEPNDPADFELIDLWGEYPNADETFYNPAGYETNSKTQGLTATRKDSIWKGNPAPGAAFGTTPENSEWTDIREKDLWDSDATTLNKWYWCAEGLGFHNTVPITVYMSTVSSLTYLVDDGYEGDLGIDGVVTGTTVEELFNNLIPADPEQYWGVVPTSGGAVLSPTDVLSNSDTLVVTSADSVNVTKYVLDVGDPLDDNAVLTSDTYTVETTAPSGQIAGMEYGVNISDVLANVVVPSTAVLNVINAQNEPVPLKTLRSDTTYAPTQVAGDIFFEVVAQNGTDIITYQLQPGAASSDAFILSDMYEVDQDLSTIDFINDNTSVSTFMSNIKPVEGATVKILDKYGMERTMGGMAYDDIAHVTSEDGTTERIYLLGFKSEFETGNTDAFITSEVYTVDQSGMVISEVPEGTPVADFRSNLVPAVGATFIVTDDLGNEQSDGSVMDGYLVDVTSENGRNTVTYSVSMPVGIEPAQSGDIRIYPNPVSDRVYISGLNEGDHIVLFNVLGVNLAQIPYEEFTGYIPMNDMDPGVYFIQIASDQSYATFKVYKH